MAQSRASWGSRARRCRPVSAARTGGPGRGGVGPAGAPGHRGGTPAPPWAREQGGAPETSPGPFPEAAAAAQLSPQHNLLASLWGTGGSPAPEVPTLGRIWATSKARFRPGFSCPTPTQVGFQKFSFETGSCSAAQVGLQLAILLPQPPTVLGLQPCAPLRGCQMAVSTDPPGYFVIA